METTEQTLISHSRVVRSRREIAQPCDSTGFRSNAPIAKICDELLARMRGVDQILFG